ncbi:MAG: hypothetical protein NVSMB64_02560 [Candidatus Velthaea sp.]
MSPAARLLRFALLVCIALAVPLSAAASPTAGSVSGRITTADGTPIVRAVVTLQGRTSEDQRADARGRFSIDGLPPGMYALSAIAGGYAALAPRPIEVRAGATTSIALTLIRSASSLTTIGTVSTAGTPAISTSSVPTQIFNTQEYAARGFTRIGDVLQDALSATVIRQGSSSLAAPQSVALRGPDPTETLVDIDGHEVNNGNSGDFDLSLLDPATFESVQVVYGIAPSALIAPSTIGGAINVRTLEPTATAHGLLRASAGSFNSFGETLQATGTANRLGYALAVHRTTTANDVSHATLTDSSGAASVVGSSVDAGTALAKLRYGFGTSGEGYAEVTFRDQSSRRDVSAALSSIVPRGQAPTGPAGPVDQRRQRQIFTDPGSAAPFAFDSFAGSMLLDRSVGYGVDLHVPLGPRSGDGGARTTALFRHLTSLSAQSVRGPAAGISSAYSNDRDRLWDDTLEIDQRLANATLALKFRLRSERLDIDGPAGPRALGGLAQTQRSAALRFAYDPTPHVHYTAAAYYSSFSTFGQSFDPRLGIVWTPTAATAFRASAGTTFQAPQLTELYVPSTLPQPDANGHINIGNANLTADRASEYDVGFEHLLGGRAHRTHVAADVYRTNLRAPSQRYLPAATCRPGAPDRSCASFPINIGNAVYTGAEFHVDEPLDSRTVVRLAYGVNSTYPKNVPPQVQTGTIVAREQFLGVALHKMTLAVEHRVRRGISYNAALLCEGRYNELNQAPFATLRAGLNWVFENFDIGLQATNITGVYDGKFTRTGAGVPYGGSAGAIATDAYPLQGPAVTVSVTRRF